jgi:hypothetical protein
MCPEYGTGLDQVSGATVTPIRGITPIDAWMSIAGGNGRRLCSALSPEALNIVSINIPYIAIHCHD